MARPAEEAQTAWCRRACTIIAPLARAREKESQALSLSLGASSLDAILASSLDEILSIPWVTLESKGSFFLVDPEDAGSLLLTTHRGLASPLLASCARVPLGRCMCGRAAASRTIVFADRVDDRHDITYDGMGPHGHYCIPVLIENRLLGVLNLYVKEGYARNPQDDTFLTAMASALALCIDRKKKDEELLRSVARLRAAMDGVVSVLARTLESRDPYTAGHQRRVASIAASGAVIQVDDVKASCKADPTLSDIMAQGIMPFLTCTVFSRTDEDLKAKPIDLREARVSALVNLAGPAELVWGTAFEGLAEVEVPLMMAFTTTDEAVKYDTGPALAYDVYPAPKYFLSFAGGNHGNFGHIDPEFFAGAAAQIPQDCAYRALVDLMAGEPAGPPALAEADQHRFVMAASAAFLQKHLAGATGCDPYLEPAFFTGLGDEVLTFKKGQ